MGIIPGFIGPANQTLAINGDSEDTINLILEAIAPGMGHKSPYQFLGTPGLRPFTTCPDSPVTQVFHQDGRAFAVAGHRFCEITYDAETDVATAIDYGGIATATDGHPPTIDSNGTAGHQLFIVSGGNGYIFDTVANTLTPISDPGFPTGSAYMGAFIDGYFLVLLADSRAFQLSALENGLSWDPLDIAERSEGSDSVVSMIRSHREIWLLGSQTTEVWVNNGDPDFPFAPLPGVFLETGCMTGCAFSAIRLEDTLFWLSQNVDGRGVVVRAKGYNPDRISTHAVDTDIQRYDFTGTRAWGYQENGHLFYVLVQPSNLWAWTFDLATGAWAKRAHWDPVACTWVPYVPQCHMHAFAKHLVGDRNSATIYDMSQRYYNSLITTP